MKLYEFQGKLLFEKYSIPVNKGIVVDNPDAALEASKQLGNNVVIKAQVLVGGRGKAGGIKIARSPENARKYAQEILSMKIKSIPVKKILVSQAVDISNEYYIGLTIDRSLKKIVLIASPAGGVDIEELAVENPEKIYTLPINPLSGIDEKKVSAFLSPVFNKQNLLDQAVQTVVNMFKLFIENDLSLIEINPYARTISDKLIALDSKIIIDDNGLFKHPDIGALKNPEEYSPDELKAREYGLSFVNMEGTIGCIVNGAGLAMATMDIIKLFGGSPANFLDVGGSSSPEKVIHAFEIITNNKNVKAILINIFGGLTRCDDIAIGILKAREVLSVKIPLVIRLIGTSEEEGRRILKEAGLTAFEDLASAVKEVVK
ncbi:Succinate--CoA ligase [ADP-forming] subunit beta [subsurface metagenome]